MGLPVTYVWTHDSIGLGEDGPTHQPIEHLAALRAIPGLDVVRPADANETAACWQADPRAHRPAGRPDPDPAERARLPARRGRLLRHQQRRTAAATCCSTPTAALPDVVLVGTGSEVQLAVAGARAAGRRRRPGPRRLDAVPGVVRRPGGVLPGDGDPADRQGAGVGRGRRRPGLARGGRRPRPDRLARALRRLRRLRAASTRSSASPPRPSPPRPRDSIRSATG